MWRLVYTLVLRLLAPVALARWWWRGRREPAYRERIGERFGAYGARGARDLFWVHAVSVGEVRASAPLVAALRREWPGQAVLVTCTTAAGREAIRQVHGETVVAAYLPYDLPRAVRRFLAHFRPRLALLMETEIWPNLLAGCAELGVPVVLANARLSESSARGYARLSGLFRPAFGSLSAVCAQSGADATRLQACGAGNVRVTGNLKFDARHDPAKLAAGRAWRAEPGARPLLLLASTREGEEALLLDALPPWDGRLLVALVPRHPQRFETVAALAAQRGFAPARRSQGARPNADCRLYLGDTMGEMAFWYGCADVAVIGGSLLPLGGQNLIEACAAGVPVVFGPSMFNFADAARFALDEGAALQVADPQGAVRAALDLLGDAERRAQMGEAGKKMCEAHRGATGRHLDAIRPLLAASAAREKPPATAPARD